jgi:signal transduction histidine kinase
MAATDFLTQAILLVTRQNNKISVPESKNLKIAGKKYIISLAESIYGLHPDYNESSKDGTFFKSLIDNIPLPIIVLTKERSIKFANEAALRYINLKLENIVDQPMYDILNLSFVSDSTLDSWLTENENSSVVNTQIWERVRLALPDNNHRQFDLAVHYSNNDSNGIETTLVLFDRTTIYERDDHDLTFVSLAVHELRTPLTIMRGYIEVFEDEISNMLNVEQKEFMHNMAASAQQLTSFVSNILNVSRIEENALLLRIKEEVWKEVLLGACKDMELRAKVHNKVLVYEIDENIPTVAVDKVSIYEVMNNLIDNAIKYTHTDE